MTNRTAQLRRVFLSGCATLALSCALFVVPASAQDEARSYAIPSEDLGAALRDFGVKSGKDVAFDAALVRDKKSSAVDARLKDEDALGQLLAGSGLKFAKTPSGSFVVQAGGSKNVQAASNDGAAAVNDSVETVSVTASRVLREGFVAPTQTTTLSAADIQVGGTTNLGSALANLPGFTPTTSVGVTKGNINIGENAANLRGLGPSRTLVLIDGARPVVTDPAGAAFAFDLNMIPTFLIKQVEVVTGGASAQWGSDAVAGVINIVMDGGFEGLKAQIQSGGDTEGYGSNEVKADLAYGFGFDGNRGHVMFGASYDTVRGVFPGSLNAVGQDGLVSNPAYTATNGQPQSLFVQGILNSNASLGGVITSGPLKGTKFGPGGTVGTFQYGAYGAGGNFMVGGDPEAGIYTTNGSFVSGPAIPPQNRDSFYGRATYDLTPHTVLTLDVMGGLTQSKEAQRTDTYLGTITILNTNAFLPTQIKTAMTAAKITSFAMGRINQDFGPVINDSLNVTQQFRLGAKGDLDGNWTWDAFYSYGATERNSSVANQPITANFNNSVNSVVSPTTGQPVCAIALTNPATNCVPVNLFGNGSASSTALAYFEGKSIADFFMYQHEAAANLRGEPLSLWAGPVSIATGLEFRHEGIGADVDALTAANAFSVLNIGRESPGSYDVEEGYFETVVPLARDLPLLQKLDFDGAVRVSNYSTSGVIPAWKLGLTDQINDELTVKGAISQDIRAPNLQELYTLQTTGTANVVNPANNVTSTITQYGGGNPSLAAEIAKTYTAGFTYGPAWFSGLDVSLDYYKIDVQNAITQIAGQTILNQCAAGITSVCSAITYGANGAVSVIRATYINAAEFKTEGFDLEADYNSDLDFVNLPGVINAKWLATYVDFLKQVTGTTVTPLAGDISAGLPRWRSTFVLNYLLDPVGFTARVRFVGGGAYSLAQTVNTSVPAVAYLDLGVQWKLPLETNVSLYADMNNVFNTVNAVGSSASAGTFYDYFGATYDVGLRLAL